MTDEQLGKAAFSWGQRKLTKIRLGLPLSYHPLRIRPFNPVLRPRLQQLLRERMEPLRRGRDHGLLCYHRPGALGCAEGSTRKSSQPPDAEALLGLHLAETGSTSQLAQSALQDFGVSAQTQRLLQPAEPSQSESSRHRQPFSAMGHLVPLLRYNEARSLRSNEDGQQCGLAIPELLLLWQQPRNALIYVNRV